MKVHVILNFEETNKSFSLVTSVSQGCDNEDDAWLDTIEEKIVNNLCREEAELYDCNVCSKKNRKVNKKQHGCVTRNTVASGKKNKLRDHNFSRTKVLSRLEEHADKKITKKIRKRIAKRQTYQFTHLEAKKENIRAILVNKKKYWFS